MIQLALLFCLIQLLSGQPGDVVVFKDDYSLADSNCKISSTNNFINGIICSQTKSWIRLQIIDYWSYYYALTFFNNKTEGRYYRTGTWNAILALEANQEYQIIRPYNGYAYCYIYFWGMKPSEYFIFTFQLAVRPYYLYYGHWNLAYVCDFSL